MTARLSITIPSVGIKTIDDQHNQLVEHLERLQFWMAKGHGFAAALDALLQVQQYVTTHFAYEEEFLRQHNYPDLDAHVKKHQLFKRDLDRLAAMVDEGNDASDELLETLVIWIKTHIGEEDVEYANYFKEINEITPQD